MAAIETARIEGLTELQAALKALPQKLHKRVLNSALMTGARLIGKEASLKAPVLQEPTPGRRPGTLRRNIRARPIRPEYSASVMVGVRKLSGKQVMAFKKANRRGGAANPDDPFYWRFVEFGTSKMAARPFLRPAFEARKVQAAMEIKDALRLRIEREANKLRRWVRR